MSGRSRRWLRFGLPCAVLLAGLVVWQRWYVVYLYQAGLGQARLLWRARPVAAALQDPQVPAAAQAKLRLVQRAKAFAEVTLGLRQSNSYTTYADIGPGPVSYALTACPADRLEYYRWWFPIVGWVPYLGFFQPDGARAAAADLDAKGYDTDVREVPAYSTLGWFADPITSPMLRYSDQDLAATIIHELTHGTLYLPGQGDFNESLANLIGMRGAIVFFCSSGAPECAAARRNWADTLAFAGFIDGVYHGLDEALKGPGDRAARLQAKAAYLARIPADFARWQEQVGHAAYPGFGRRKLNNAVILSLYLYYRHLRLFEEAYARQHQDLKSFLERVRAAVQGAEDPLSAVQRLGGAVLPTSH